MLDGIIKKRLSLKAVGKAARISKEVKLNLEAFFVIGFPGETLRNMISTIAYAHRLQFKYGVYPSIFIATPLPGTRLYETCLAKGYIKEDFSYSRIHLSILREGMIETEDFDLSDIKRLSVYFRIMRDALTVINFLKFCLSSPIFVIKKVAYLFKIFFLSRNRRNTFPIKLEKSKKPSLILSSS